MTGKKLAAELNAGEADALAIVAKNAINQEVSADYCFACWFSYSLQLHVVVFLLPEGLFAFSYSFLCKHLVNYTVVTCLLSLDRLKMKGGRT